MQGGSRWFAGKEGGARSSLYSVTEKNRRLGPFMVVLSIDESSSLAV